MAQNVPFLFCRYGITVDDERLDPIGQKEALLDAQGAGYEHGYGRDGRPAPLVLIMEPSDFRVDRHQCLSWRIGMQRRVRNVTTYDANAQRRRFRLEDDAHTKDSLMIAVASKGLLAVQDQSNDDHIGARSALSCFKTLVREVGEGAGELNIIHLDDDDVDHALNNWELTQYMYSISPLNPITASTLATQRSDAMKAEGVGVDRGVLLPRKGGRRMRMNEGGIQSAHELVQVGYGQDGLKAITPGGQTAHIAKPRFHDDRQKNLEERKKPRHLRIYFEKRDEEEELIDDVVRSLLDFYER